MQTLGRAEDSVHVEAPPQAVYDLVADVTRTPEYSPEVDDVVWLDDGGPRVGARFRARNRVGAHPRFSWHNKPIIMSAEPGREFAFARTEPFAGTLVWRYRFEPEGTGTRVTESYEVARPVRRAGWFIIGTLGRDPDRMTTMRKGLHESLQRLKRVAEADAASPPAAS
ncbi:SRPBCC family protein [Kocuria sp. CPCC 205292]|uniref:SRPBCC family protein n=1 Tax=Kocuria cellulosilytica TaxID=3071451 RepID=UPI0034D596EF